MNAKQLQDFEHFWSLYPRRVGKGAARKAFEKALKLASADAINTGLRRQLSYYQTREHQFIPHPSTWLNGERWDDDPQPTKQRVSGDMADFTREYLENRNEQRGTGRASNQPTQITLDYAPSGRQH